VVVDLQLLKPHFQKVQARSSDEFYAIGI
jgi:hypothetical protein